MYAYPETLASIRPAMVLIHDLSGGYGSAWLMVLGVMTAGTLLIMPLRAREAGADQA